MNQKRKGNQMRNTFLKTIGGMALALVVLATLAPTRKALSQQDGGGRLDGTWDVVLTARNCQTGTAITSFPEVATFMSGGTMIDSTSGLAQSLKTPGQGIWSHVSGNTYRFSFKSLNFNAAGSFTGSTRVTHELTLNSEANEYTSAGTADIFDANGVLIATRCSTTTATRFE